METDYLFSIHNTLPGIKVEEVSGCNWRTGKVWLALAKAVWTENFAEGYRTFGHTESGAPLLLSDVEALEHTRISVTHTPDLLLVASMPMDADTDPATFAPRYALGIDAEDAGREQVLKVRSRFLNDEELQAIAADSVEQNILAWTCKEALLKAGTDSATDIRQALRISKLPQIAARPQAKAATGKGVIGADGPTPIELNLFSFRLSGHIVTIAYP